MKDTNDQNILITYFILIVWEMVLLLLAQVNEMA